MSNIPFMAIGEGELNGNKTLKKGDIINCPHCSKGHPIKLGKTEDGVETNSIMFYNCGKKTYLCGVDGTALFNTTLKTK